MRIPLGENEMGAIYKCGKTDGFFYTLDSAFYNNCMINSNAPICTYVEFKKMYPICIGNNHRRVN